MDERDLYHTYFGIAGLNMLGYLADHGFPSIPIHPAFALRGANGNDRNDLITLFVDNNGLCPYL